MPEMRRVTVRFGESLWSLIEDEANRDAVSAAHWLRDAALARALWERQRRGVTLGPDILQLVRREASAESERIAQLVEDVTANATPELLAVLEKLPPTSAAYLRELYGL